MVLTVLDRRNFLLLVASNYTWSSF